MSLLSSAPPETATVLRTRDLSKAYPGVRALQGASLTVKAGSIHALIGQNGAGKTTLVKLLSGVERPDAGTIEVDGRPVAFTRPADAQAAGVQTIHQELSLVPHLSVAENIFLGDPPTRGSAVVKWQDMREGAKQALDQLGFTMDVTQPVARFTVAEQQGVELAKALHKRARLILLDEPTATLPRPDVEKLFSVLRALAADGTSLVYISHRLDEITQLCDTVTVLRDGELVASRPVESMSTMDMVSAMVGSKQIRSLEGAVLTGERVASLGVSEPGKTLLSARGLSDGQRFSGVDLDLREGEVLGIVGLVGSGQSEVASCLAGVRPRASGTIELSGKSVRLRGSREAVRRGVGFLPQDRKSDGFVPEMSVAANITLASLPQFSRFSVRNPRRELSVAREFAQRLDMRIANVGQSMRTLSGGNQQKAIMARWLVRAVQVLICDEPTRGVDVAARAEMYELIREFAHGEGHAAILATSELSEALMCDRVIVMASGRAVITLDHDEIDPHGEAVLAHFA